MLIFCYNIINFIIVFQLATSHLLILFFYLTIVNSTVEFFFLYTLFHQIACVVHYLLLLAELARMDYHQILIEVKFTHVFRETAIHSQCQRKLFLHFLLYVSVDLVLEQFLPTHSFFRICF